MKRRKRKPKPTHDGPQIYVASLSDYNDGRLHGEWIDATNDADEIREEIQQMLAKSRDPGAEEWAIHDSSGFEGLSIGEHASIDDIAEAAEMIEEFGAKAAQVIDYYGGISDLDEARTALTDRYAGSAEDLESWAQEHLDDIGLLEEVPEGLRSYFDFERYARDLDLGGDIFTVRADGELHVFWTN